MNQIYTIATISALVIFNSYNVSAKSYPIQKIFYENDTLGGDCKVNKMYIDTETKRPSVNFEFSITKANSYFISAWALPSNIKDEITTVFLDGVKIGVLHTTKKT